MKSIAPSSGAQHCSQIDISLEKSCNTVVPGFRVPGFRTLPGFRALNPGNVGWSVHKTLFGFRAPLFWPFCLTLG